MSLAHTRNTCCAIALAAGLAACGGGSDGGMPSGAAPAPPPTPTPTPTPAPTPAPGTVSLITGSLGGSGNLDGKQLAARFEQITAMTPDRQGNLLVIDDRAVRKVSASGEVSTIMPFSSQHRFISVAVTTDNSVLLLDASESSPTNERRLYALQPDGSLTLKSAPVPGAYTAMAAGAGGTLYLYNYRQVAVASAAGDIIATAGNPQAKATPCQNGSGSGANFSAIQDAAPDAGGNLLVLDCGTVRKVTPAGVVTTLAGAPGVFLPLQDGGGSTAHFSGKGSIAVAPNAGGALRMLELVTESINGANQFSYGIRQVTPAGVVSTQVRAAQPAEVVFAPAAPSSYRLLRYLSGGQAIVATNRELWQLDDSGKMTPFAGDEGDVTGDVIGTLAQTRFVWPKSISADQAGNLYVLDESGDKNTTAYQITPAGQVRQLFQRNDLDRPGQIISAPDGTLYITQVQNLGPTPKGNLGGVAIFKVAPGGTPQLFAGSSKLRDLGMTSDDGTGSAATFFQARLIGFDTGGNLYVEDTINMLTGAGPYRRITPNAEVTTISVLPAGVGLAPDGCSYNTDGLAVYRHCADGSNSVVAGVPFLSMPRAPLGNQPGSPGVLENVVSITPTGPGTFALISGGAILKLVVKP